MVKIPFNLFENFIKGSLLEFVSKEEVAQLYEALSQIEIENNQKIAREEPPQFLYFSYNGKLTLKHRLFGYEVGSVRNGQSIEFRTMVLRSPQWHTDWYSHSAQSLLRIPWAKVEPILTKYPSHVSYLTKLAQSTSLQRFKRDLLALNFSTDFIFQLISRLNLISSANFQQLQSQGLIGGNFFFNVANGELDIAYGTDLGRRKLYTFKTGESNFFPQFKLSSDINFLFNAETRLFVLLDKDFEGLKSHENFEKFNLLFFKYKKKKFKEIEIIPIRERRVPKKEADNGISHLKIIQDSKSRNIIKEMAQVLKFPTETTASLSDKPFYQRQAIINELLRYFSDDLKTYEFFSRENFFDEDTGVSDFYYDLNRIGFKCKSISNIEDYDIRLNRWYVAASGERLILFKYNSRARISILNTESGVFDEVSEEEFFQIIKHDNVIEISGLSLESARKKKKLKYVNYFEFNKIINLIWDKKSSIFLSLGLTFWIYLFSLSFPIATQYMLDQIVQFGKVDRLPFLSFSLLFFAVTSTYFESINQKMTIYLSGLLSLRMKGIVHNHLFSESKFKKMNIPQSIVISRMAEIEMISGLYINQILPSVVNFSLMLFSLVIVYMYSPLISALYLLAIPVSFALISLKKNQITNLKNLYFKSKENELESFTDSYSRYDTTLSHKQNLQARWKIESTYDLTNRYAKINSFIQSAYQTLQLFKTEFLRISTFLVALGLYKVNHLTLGQVLALTMLAPRFGSLIQSIVGAYFQYFNFKASLDKLNELLTEPQMTVISPNTAVASLADEEDKIGLKVESLSFVDKFKNVVLDQVSFSIGATEQLVLLGDNNICKNSLIKILCGQEVNYSGRLRHGSPNVRLAFLDSDFNLFTGSLLFNLTLDDKNPDLARLSSIIEELGLENEILSKPDGLNFPIQGNGSQLSPSEIKKILLVRVIYLQPDILICDNMNDYFDNITENELFVSVKKLMKNGILVWSTQNFSLATKSTHVLCLDQGQVKSFGNHKELVEIDSLYTQFFVNKITLNS
jgi:ABC-type bacteriocin/lantibiotic exporter with double-glycine peptidase domain